MTLSFEHPSSPEPRQPDFGIINEHGSKEKPDGRDHRRPLTIAIECGRPEASNDAPLLSFARLAPPARIKTADDAVEGNPAAAGDFVASIREAIESLSCGEDYPTIRTTAEFVGMSVRTLQRRLAKAGASHHMLVAQARFATAAAVLERTDAKILELALDLGYSDHANFTRAFRRWAGCAPREYRSNSTRHEDVPDPSSPRSTGLGEVAPAPNLPICTASSPSRTSAAQNGTGPGSKAG